MSAALINRSLTNVRTELEFLLDSEVIDKALYDKLVAALPIKYSKDMATWGVEKLSGLDSVADSLAKTTLHDDISPPSHPPTAAVPPRSAAPALGYCKASYDYEAREDGDLRLVKGDRIAVLEHLSPDWWKGYKQGRPEAPGVFPSNYVSVISETEFNSTDVGRSSVPVPEKASYNPEKNQSAAPPSYNPSPVSQYQPPAQYQQQQPSYGGYSQFPPPSANYYPPQQQQPQQAPQEAPQQHNGNNHLKKFGSKLGNAAIFGAGATIGSDIVNLIF